MEVQYLLLQSNIGGVDEDQKEYRITLDQDQHEKYQETFLLKIS